MKIGILTWAFNTNYGGALQAFSLNRYLSKLRYDSEIIDFLPKKSDLRVFQNFTYKWNPNSRFVKNVFRLTLYRLIVLLFKGDNVFTSLRVWNSKLFFHKYLRPTFKIRNSEELNVQRRYGAILIGSDQVWNPNSLDESFLLLSVPDSVKKLAYAPSVAVRTINAKIGLYRRALPRFQAVSLRERSALKEIEICYGSPVKWVVDPVLLLTRFEWGKELDLTEGKVKSYDFIYWLSDLESEIGNIITYANKNHRNIHLYVDLISFPLKSWRPSILVRHIYNVFRLLCNPYIKFRKWAGPKTFVKEISCADKVITNSFHGMMFSIIFNRRFMLISDDERKGMESRMLDFLEKIHARVQVMRSLATGLENSDFADTLNEQSRCELEKWICESQSWLINKLKEAIK